MDQYQACNCMGPQPGFPLCPCQMRGLIERDGRWIRPEQDMGPVHPKEVTDAWASARMQALGKAP